MTSNAADRLAGPASSIHQLIGMAITTDIHETLRLNQARRQPNLPLVPFSVSELINVTRQLIPDVRHHVQLKFVSYGPLACVVHDEADATIFVHQLLNHPDTPREVMTMVIKHELLHLCFPSPVDGHGTDHPPEYREAEKAITPELDSAWLWIYGNYAECVKRRPELEKIDVLPGWRRIWSRPRISLIECHTLAQSRQDHPQTVSLSR